MIGYAALGETRRLLFSTQDNTGAAINADALPTILVYEQGTSIVAGSPVVTNKTTGLYEVALVLTAANGFEVGKEYSIAAIAVVAAKTGRIPIGSFVLDPQVPRGVTSGVPTTSVIPTNIAVATTDFYKDAWLLVEDGACAGQVKRIGSMSIGGQITLATGYVFSTALAAGVNVRIVNR